MQRQKKQSIFLHVCSAAKCASSWPRGRQCPRRKTTHGRCRSLLLRPRCGGSLARSGLRLPAAVFETLSIYLLLAIGLKGGVEIARSESATLWVDALLAIGLGAIIPLLVFPLFRLRFSRPDAASLSAHYGSVSIVTFAVGCGGAGRARDRGRGPPRPARRADGGAGADRGHADRARGG
jgi:Predicted permease